MKKKLIWMLVLTMLMTLTTGAAPAEDVFKFESKEVSVFEGETFELEPLLIREGNPATGDLSWKSASPKVASVADDGTVTAIKKGSAAITVKMTAGKKTWKANITVNVLRRVTDVTLNTNQLTVYQPTDPQVGEFLAEDTEFPVILLPAGKSADLKVTVTPSDASSKKVTISSSDEGVLKISGTTMKAIQAGKCDLTIASQQNPEVAEIFRVLVTQPVTKVIVTADGKAVRVGETLQLHASCEPGNATITAVTWSSRSPKIAEVNDNGTVTGLKKGSAEIIAKAADGSGKSGAFTVTVEQQPTGITIAESTLNLVAGKSGQLHATVTPSDANDKSLSWFSSDESIATVNSQGKVTALRRGECTVTAVCNADPDLTASAEINVIQQVTAIRFNDANLSIPVRSGYQLSWTVEPADATIQDVTFSTNNKKVATVDADGYVTAGSRGSAVITAKATDGSNKQAQIKIQVYQPVEGVSIQYPVYHIQKEGQLNVKALIQPSDANNIAVEWSIDDESVATVKGNGKNIGTVRGRKNGTTTLTATTVDGGFTATAEIRVADFNRAVVVDDVYLEKEQIRLVFRNRERFAVSKVYFKVECYSVTGDPIMCNTDGKSSSFTGYYDLELLPDECTEHYRFTFDNYVRPVDPICGMNVYITGWKDTEGYTRNIPEEAWPMRGFYRYLWQNTGELDVIDDMVLVERDAEP